MDFPRAIFIFFLFLIFYLALQFFLFVRIRGYLRQRFTNPSQTLLTFLTGAFFLLMLVPLIWRAVFGFQLSGTDPWWVRRLSALWTVWGFGSTGAALILFSYGFYRRIVSFFKPRGAPDPRRRDFLKSSVGVVAAAPFLLSGYGLVLGRRRFEVEHFDLALSGLPSALSQFSIVQLTDIHAGPFMPEEELSSYVEAVNRLKPDLVALTGDFVSNNPGEIIPCVNALAKLKARYGVFACIGNHDVYTGIDDELPDLFGKKGIRLLRNDGISLPIGNTVLAILGIDDLVWGDPDLSSALAAAPASEVRCLLSHRPEVFPDASRRGIDVVLSGHYHGGQVKLAPDPEALSIARLITPYAEGMFRLPRRSAFSEGSERDTLLFVSRGIGITALPIRVNCPPQIAHLRFVAHKS